MICETARILVRDWRPDEADRFLAIYTCDDVMRWLGRRSSGLQDRADAEQRIDQWRASNGQPAGTGRWAVEVKGTGVVAGTVLLLPLPGGHGELEVGWHLHPDSWGRGYASEAAAAVLHMAFQQGLDEVFAVVRPGNTASVAVCRRLGMEPLGLTDRYYETELELFRSAPPVPETVAPAR